MRVVFKGILWKVQLQVFDYTDEISMQYAGEFAGHISFVVSRLPIGSSPRTNYYSGEQLYYGPSIEAAMVAIEGSINRKPELPYSWDKYIKKETPCG